MVLPSIWRTIFISCIFEKIIIEIFGNLIIVHDSPRLRLILKRTFEQIQRTIIFIAQEVFEIIFEGDPKLAARIILANLELEIFEIPIEILMRPSLLDIPILTAPFDRTTCTFNNDGLHWPLIFVDELFNSKGFRINSINITRAIT